MKFLSNLTKQDLAGKTVLLRVDFNIDRENAEHSWRLESIFGTIEFLLESNTKIVLMSHVGRPKSIFKIGQTALNVEEDESLAFIKPILEKRFEGAVSFIPHFDFEKIKFDIEKANLPAIFLLENLRLLSGEESNDPELSRALSSLGDIYVNDAFAVDHRAHASTYGITNFLPHYAGLRLEAEIDNLSKFLDPSRPLVVIIGGAKISDKIDVILGFLDKADYLLTGGGLSTTLLKARGLDVGGSLYDEDKIDFAKELLGSSKILIPIDSRKDGDVILDIGPKTEKKYGDVIRKAKSVVWSGPVGYFERPEFANGSKFIAQEIINSGAKSLVGGGQTALLLLEMGVIDKFTFVSTGGGAMLDFLVNKKLPGIEALG